MRVNKKGAIEMSIGTIVTIVLSMSMLILGMVLISNIMGGADDITTMTNDQVKNQVAGMFGEDKKLGIYPDTRQVEVEIGELGGFGVIIKNLLRGSQPNNEFEYEVVVSDPDIMKKCGVNDAEALGWITTGRSDKFPIATGETEAGKVLIEIPEGTSLCTFRYRINVKANGADYDSDLIDVTIVA